jgi:hypothetical protein
MTSSNFKQSLHLMLSRKRKVEIQKENKIGHAL